MLESFEILLSFLATVALLFIAFLVFVATRPNHFRLYRTGLIHASPAVVFNIINHLRTWDRWSPWEKLDPNMNKKFSGPEAGPGAVSTWSGNSQAGEGRMTILESKPNDYVSLKLEFFKPWVATNQVRFELTPVGKDTQVTWIMEGSYNFMAKLFGLFFNMDKLVGKDFEEGLANLDRLAQAESRK